MRPTDLPTQLVCRQGVH